MSPSPRFRPIAAPEAPDEPNLTGGPGLVVLGCRVVGEEPSPALRRRLEGAYAVALQIRPAVVVMCGGRRWGAHQEAAVMGTWWRTRGGPGELVLEGRSLSTYGNAREASRLLSAGPSRELCVVTCDYHLERAMYEFQRAGLDVSGHGVPSGLSGWKRRRTLAREWGAGLLSKWLLSMTLLASLPGCDQTAAGSKATSEQTKNASPTEGAPNPADFAISETRARWKAREPLQEDEAALNRWLLARDPAATWAAWGLGQLASTLPLKDSDTHPVSQGLRSAAALWALEPPPQSPERFAALGQALGALGSESAEKTLTSWLLAQGFSESAHLDQAAAFGLGRLADRRGQLSEASLTALLDAAESRTMPSLLYPLGRLSTLPAAFAGRTLDVARLLLAKAELGTRRDILFALGSAGEEAVPLLLAVAQRTDAPLPERTAALQTLTRLGDPGQKALDGLVRTLIAAGIPPSAALPSWPVLFAALDGLKAPQASLPFLVQLERARLPEPGQAPSPQETRALAAERRRIIRLRCRAAELRALPFSHTGLTSCDPDGTAVGAMSKLRAVDAVPWKGAPVRVVESLLGAPQPAVLQATLRAMMRHREYADREVVLLRFLRHPEPTVRALSWQLVAERPEGLLGRADLLPDVLSALSETLADPHQPTETLARALDAAGALGALTLKAAVDRFCSSTRADAYALSRAAERALGLLGNPQSSCRKASPEPSEPNEAVLAKVTMDSDLGPLTLWLDGRRSPQVVQALLTELEQGRYEGAPITAHAPGFALHWAEPNLGRPKAGPAPLLPPEPSPRGPRQGELALGLPESRGGPETLFFALSDAPQLAGQKAIVGRFSGPAELLLEGDLLDHIVMTRGAALAKEFE